MTNLPSFIELMATLGIDNNANVSEFQARNSSHSRSSSSSSASSPRLFSISSTSRQAHKTRSIPSLRDLESDRRLGLNRHRTARYSPYSFGHSDGRRESLPYIAGHGVESERPLRPLSTSPKSCSLSSSGRHVPPQLENISGYSEELSHFPLENQADTPISSYVRRKTPQTSPISPTFPRYIFHEQTREHTPISSPSTMPFLLPTLPSIHSDVTFSVPSSDAGSDRGSSARSSPFLASNSLPEIMEVEPLPRHTGLRLSAPHRVETEHQHHHSRHVSPV